MAADIDFDELDRAVSSLIGKVPDDTKPDTKVDEVLPAMAKDETPASAPVSGGDKIAVSIFKSTPEPESTPVPQVMSTTPVPAAPAARRSVNGRFMDVVHPSADMRPNANDDTRPSLIPVKPQGENASPEQPISGEAATETAPSVELHTAATVHGPVVDDEAAKLDALLTKDLSLDEPPQSSPFLPNAKVEKRPLGAFSSDDTDPAAPGTKQIIDTPDSSNDPVPVDTQSTAIVPTVKPSEDLLKAVEDEQAKAAEKAAEDDVKAKEEAKKSDVDKLDAEAQVNLTSDMNMPLPEELQSDVLAIESAATPTPETPTATTVSAGPTSIVPQYKEKVSSAKPSGAIYDTEAYHKPLQHPVQKKSGLLLVLVIVGIIIVGGGVGAAVYFFGLPLLQR